MIEENGLGEWIFQLVPGTVGMAPSRSDAERPIKEGGVELDGARMADIRHEIDCSRLGTILPRAGKNSSAS